MGCSSELSATRARARARIDIGNKRSYLKDADGQDVVVDDAGDQLQLADHIQHLLQDWEHLRARAPRRSFVALARTRLLPLCTSSGLVRVTHLRQTRVARRGDVVIDVHGHAASAGVQMSATGTNCIAGVCHAPM